MDSKFSQIKDQLQEKNIRLSHQRLAVLEYLYDHCCHPTADQIYNGLKEEIPTLSKTTIYNTMNAFVEAGIVHRIKLDDHELRYDLLLDDHGHFKCRLCQQVYDFKTELAAIQSEDLKDFVIEEREVFFQGICKDCLS